MNGKTTLLLLALLALLAGGAWFQLKEEKHSEMIEQSLFEGLVPGRMKSIRVENLRRNTQMSFEAQPDAGWMMTDPLHYPADRALIRNLVENIISAKGLAVPANERGSQELGFEPPRAVLEIDQLEEDGELVTFKLEIGAEDLNRNLMNVRVEGVYLRALSSLYVPIDLGVEEFRSRAPLSISPRSVVEIQRSGKVKYSVNDEPNDLELVAIRDSNRWYSNTPIQMALDSFHVGFLISGATSMEVEAFVEDNCTNFHPYGLADPVCRLELKLGGDRSETLLIGRLGDKMPWHMTREGTPYVWKIRDTDALRLLMPAEGMVDLKFMHILRDDIRGLKLRQGDRETSLARGEQGWTVQAGSSNGAGATLQMADQRKVEDALARLEQLEFTHDEELAIYGTGGLGPGFEPLGAIEVLELDGSQGGEYGRVPGRDGLYFLRFGDDLPLVAPAWFEELAQGQVADYRSLQLTRFTEGDLASILFRSAEGERRFVRDNRGLWHPEGEEREATELLPMLDSMIYLKARDFPAKEVSVVGGVDVVFTTHGGVSTEFRIEGDGKGRSLARLGGSQALLKRDDLYEALLALWGE